MTDAACAAIEGLFSFIIGCSIGFLYCNCQWKKWLKNHRCGDVTIEVHGGGGWGGSGIVYGRDTEYNPAMGSKNAPGGFSDMTGDHGGKV